VLYIVYTFVGYNNTHTIRQNYLEQSKILNVDQNFQQTCKTFCLCCFSRLNKPTNTSPESYNLVPTSRLPSLDQRHSGTFINEACMGILLAELEIVLRTLFHIRHLRNTHKMVNVSFFFFVFLHTYYSRFIL
jgi:hypothetical protein